MNGGSTSLTRAYYDMILGEFRDYIIKEEWETQKASIYLMSAALKEGRKKQETAKESRQQNES